jgi:hypothetical protein
LRLNELIFWWVSEELVQLLVRGCGLGLLAVGVTILFALLSQNKRLLFKPAGLILSLAFLIGEKAIHPIPIQVWFAIFLSALSQELSERSGKLSIVCMIFGVIVLASYSIGHEPLWLKTLFVAGAVCFSRSTSKFEKRHSPFLVTSMILLSVGAIFSTVPDTEEITLLFGILLPATIVASFYPVRSLNRIGTVPLTMIFIWVICIGGVGRAASIITSIGCLGFLILEPFAHSIGRFANRSFVISPISAFAYHSLSITLALGYARTTANLWRSTIATIAALSVPFIFIILTEALNRVKFRDPLTFDK